MEVPERHGVLHGLPESAEAFLSVTTLVALIRVFKFLLPGAIGERNPLALTSAVSDPVLVVALWRALRLADLTNGSSAVLTSCCCSRLPLIGLVRRSGALARRPQAIRLPLTERQPHILV